MKYVRISEKDIQQVMQSDSAVISGLWELYPLGYSLTWLSYTNQLRGPHTMENYKNLTEAQRRKLIEDAMIVHSND